MQTIRFNRLAGSEGGLPFPRKLHACTYRLVNGVAAAVCTLNDGPYSLAKFLGETQLRDLRGAHRVLDRLVGTTCSTAPRWIFTFVYTFRSSE